MNRRSLARLAALALPLLACEGTHKPLVVAPPTTAKVDESLPLASRSPELFAGSAPFSGAGRAGLERFDPFAELEDAESEATKKRTVEENARTRAYLDKVPGRDAFRNDIQKFLQVGTLSAPAVRKAPSGKLRYFHTKREGAQNQSTLYVRDGRDGKDRVLIDVSALAQDGTVALDWWYPSRDGRLVAWGRSENGSEESVLHVRDVDTGKDLPLAIDRTRHASVAWKPDGTGFYYSRYPEKGTVPAGDEKYGSKIYFHAMGADPKDDTQVFGEGRDKLDVPQVSISSDGKWLVFHVHMGWDKNELFVRSATQPNAKTIPVAVGKRARFSAIARPEGLFVQTNDGAPTYALYQVSYADLVAGKGREAWKTVIPEARETLEDVVVTKKEIVVTYLKDAETQVVRFGRDGTRKGEVALPPATTASLAVGLDGEEIFVRHDSYARPPKVEALGDTTLAPWDRVGAGFSADDVEVVRLFATSKDGTKIPLFVVSKGPLKHDGKAPTVLYGYGGFNVNQTPQYSARVMSVLSRGGVWAHAILRGGGEYGEAWHAAGMLDKKQNVFDDYYACAEKLVAEKITSKESLGAMGGSNGGLLVAVAITQRPELFRAGLSLVPLTDMLRFHKFRIGKLWIPEYGDPDEPKARAVLESYSPYHHVKAGTRYPSVLFTTAESDSRVDPMHARKMAARLRAAQADPSRPVLLRVETKAGHGAGKPVGKLADEMADELSFLLNELGKAP
ncbi:MAG: prolyl oligopeptidase family serine peptidase [Polyangiaceae bacterium]